MRIHDHPTRRGWKIANINWSRALTFSERQVNFILDALPRRRGVYCIYCKRHREAYVVPGLANRRRSPVVYIGSGVLRRRLRDHLLEMRNPILASFLHRYDLAYRYDLIEDDDLRIDWPRQVEAGLLILFQRRFGKLPPANRRPEPNQQVPDTVRMYVHQSLNFHTECR